MYQWVQYLVTVRCYTFTGLREMLTRGSTLEFALAVIIGEQFNAFILSLVTDLIAPMILFLFAADHADIRLVPGGIILLANPNEANVTSAEMAQTNGCLFVSYQSFFFSLLSFIIVMSTVYWFIAMLESWRKKDRVQAAQEERENSLNTEPLEMECPACIQMISVRAKRCPHCTSFVNEVQGSSVFRPSEDASMILH